MNQTISVRFRLRGEEAKFGRILQDQGIDIGAYSKHLLFQRLREIANKQHQELVATQVKGELSGTPTTEPSSDGSRSGEGESGSGNDDGG